MITCIYYSNIIFIYLYFFSSVFIGAFDFFMKCLSGLFCATLAVILCKVGTDLVPHNFSLGRRDGSCLKILSGTTECFTYDVMYVSFVSPQ